MISNNNNIIIFYDYDSVVFTKMNVYFSKHCIKLISINRKKKKGKTANTILTII